MKPDLQMVNVELTCEVIPPTIEVMLDDEQIEMVLINLVKNSKEALLELPNAQIKISAYKDGEHTVIKVSDNGPGIIPEAIERIFIPFFSTKKTGSGIGLALSRQIMQQHGGSISVESEPNKYTQFMLRFV